MTPEALAKAQATRAARRAGEPLVILAKALKIQPQTLRARLYYHGVKLKGATMAALIAALEKYTRSKLPKAVLKLRGAARAPPPVNDNPRKARKPPVAVDDEHVGLIALQRAVNLTCERVGTGDYDERDLSVLSAGLRMLPRKRR